MTRPWAAGALSPWREEGLAEALKKAVAPRKVQGEKKITAGLEAWICMLPALLSAFAAYLRMELLLIGGQTSSVLRILPSLRRTGRGNAGYAPP